MNESFSPKEALDSAIRSYNPFSQTGIVRGQDVWETGFPDIPNINANIFATILSALKQVKSSKSSQNKVASLVMSAVPGSGKSHTFGRLRHTLETENSGLFVYASVDKYSDLNLLNYHFQQSVAESLSRFNSEDVTQWQEVATAMVNQANKVKKPDAHDISLVQLKKQIERSESPRSEQGKNLIDKICQAVMKLQKNQIDPYLIKAILLTLSESRYPFAIRWLSGQDLHPNESQELGLQNHHKTHQEADSLRNVIQILNLVSCYKPVIICFDEIEVNTNCRDDGLTAPLVIADLVKRLYDSLQQSASSQGVVILTAMSATTWKTQFTQGVYIAQSTIDRISTFTKGEPVEFSPIKSDSLIELINLWLNKFYSEQNLKAPPLYPFNEKELIEFAKNKPTIREALKWCAEHFTVSSEMLPKKPQERFDLAFHQEELLKLDDFLENNSFLGTVLRFGFSTLIGEVLKGKTSTGELLDEILIESIEEVQPKNKNNDYINFKLICNRKGKTLKIGVAVIQDTKGRSVGAGMLRIIDYDTFNLTKGCLVRSKARKIDKKWEAHKHLHQLINELKGEWVDLKEDEIKPLIQLYLVDQNRDNYRLTEEQVKRFCSKITKKNNLLLEILSDAPSTIEDDDDSIIPSEPIVESSSEDDDFSDLFDLD